MENQKPDIVVLVKDKNNTNKTLFKKENLSLSDFLDTKKLTPYKSGEKINMVFDNVGEKTLTIDSIGFWTSTINNELVIEIFV